MQCREAFVKREACPGKIKPNLFIHDMSRIGFIEEQPVPENGIAEHLSSHVINRFKRETVFTGGLVTDVEEDELGEAGWMVIV